MWNVVSKIPLAIYKYSVYFTHMLKHIISFAQGVGSFMLGIAAFIVVKLLIVAAFGLIVWIALLIHDACK